MQNKDIMSFVTSAEANNAKKSFSVAKKNYKEAITHPEFKNESEEVKVDIFLNYHQSVSKTIKAYTEIQFLNKIDELTDALSVLEDFGKNLLKDPFQPAILLAKAELWADKVWLYVLKLKDISLAYELYCNTDALLSTVKTTDQALLKQKGALEQELKNIYQNILSLQGDQAEAKNELSTAKFYYTQAAEILQASVSTESTHTYKLVNDRLMSDFHILADTYFKIGKIDYKSKEYVSAASYMVIARGMYREGLGKDNDKDRMSAYRTSLAELSEYIQKPELASVENIPSIQPVQQSKPIETSPVSSSPKTQSSPKENKQSFYQYIVADVENFCKEHGVSIKSGHIPLHLKYSISPRKEDSWNKYKKVISRLLSNVSSERIGIDEENQSITIQGNTIFTLHKNANGQTASVPSNFGKQFFLSNESHSQAKKVSPTKPKTSKTIEDEEKSLKKKNKHQLDEKSSKKHERNDKSPQKNETTKRRKIYAEHELRNMTVEELQTIKKQIDEQESEKKAAIANAKIQLAEQIKANQMMLEELNNSTYSL